MGKSIAAAKQCTGSLVARQNETVRIYVGNAGPNLISSFHVIGQIFDNVYREGDLLSPPAHSLQKILVPAAGSAVVEFTPRVLGSFLLVDHAILHLHHDGAMALIAIVLIVQM